MLFHGGDDVLLVDADGPPLVGGHLLGRVQNVERLLELAPALQGPRQVHLFLGNEDN